MCVLFGSDVKQHHKKFQLTLKRRRKNTKKKLKKRTPNEKRNQAYYIAFINELRAHNNRKHQIESTNKNRELSFRKILQL